MIQDNATNEILQHRSYIKYMFKSIKEMTGLNKLCEDKLLYHELEYYITDIKINIDDRYLCSILPCLENIENIITNANSEFFITIADLENFLEETIDFIKEEQNNPAGVKSAKKLVREYLESSEYKNVNLLIMHKNIEGEYNIGNADSDDSNYFIVPSDSSIACFYYDYDHYCIDKELIRYAYNENGELIAIIYYEDLNIDYVTPQCPITFVGIE